MTRINAAELRIALLEGIEIELEKATFDLLDAEGKKIASVSNFPVNLAYASTIHKSQGATLDQVVVNLRSLWEPGHAYVALSRVRSSEGLIIEAWDRNSVKIDPAVAHFHQSIFD